MRAARASTPFRRALSHAFGWIADRRVPKPLRDLVYGAYCRATGADPSEARLRPRDYPSLNAFFVRGLKEGARPVDPDPEVLPSPCDGTVQAVATLAEGRLLAAKGLDYPARDLLAGLDEGLDLDGAAAWTLYLAPLDYHRVHAPLEGALERVAWVPGARYSVAPGVVGRVRGLFAANERAVLRLATPRGPYLLVMVGALNVGRIRVVGVERDAQPAAPRRFGRGDELARFEMGSTVVLILPRALGFDALDLAPGDRVRLGSPIGRARGGPAGAARAVTPGERSG